MTLRDVHRKMDALVPHLGGFLCPKCRPKATKVTAEVIILKKGGGRSLVERCRLCGWQREHVVIGPGLDRPHFPEPVDPRIEPHRGGFTT